MLRIPLEGPDYLGEAEKAYEGVAARAIGKAVIWTKAKILAARGVFREDDPIVEQIVIKRALYELYSHAENEAVAQDKKEDAMELLRAVYGNAVDGTGYSFGSSGHSPVPVAAVVRSPKE